MSYNAQTRTLTTERLLLRPFTQNDAKEVSDLCNNYKIHKTTRSVPYPYSIECALDWIADQTQKAEKGLLYEFAVTDRKTGQIYGAISLTHDKEHQNGEAGYWIGEEFWGFGYATESMLAILNFAFYHHQYHKVYAYHFASNPASGRVLQKCGMQREGILVDQVFKNDVFETLVCYGIVRPTPGTLQF